MSNTGVIIQGSARAEGNTKKVAEIIGQATGFPIIDLVSKNIGPFDYEFRNREDDFLPLMQDIADNCDTIILITPVYWYTMSGLMKNFIDRFSDLLKVEKEMGRKLCGKSLALISNTSGPNINPGFATPVDFSAQYLGMKFLGHFHAELEGDDIPESVQQALRSLYQPV